MLTTVAVLESLPIAMPLLVTCGSIIQMLEYTSSRHPPPPPSPPPHHSSPHLTQNKDKKIKKNRPHYSQLEKFFYKILRKKMKMWKVTTNPTFDYSLELDVYYALHNMQLQEHITTTKSESWMSEEKPLHDQHIIDRRGPGA
ncbi:hypothetical protein E2C01_022106 [Portunus trituberculatus]|uniref:Uncharacterized protein n=1 Tax=Portunus trituberculatus TaxID=210409 RepID=A0A5B7E6S5_PORTR|nr:hypothetical protein [Portunus trituberculatus]